MHKILFVCSGNICRSPSADAVMRQMIIEKGLSDKITCDSAGMHGLHAGEAPDPRSQKTASKRGYDLSTLRARQFHTNDFDNFTLILAMDNSHLEDMKAMMPQDTPAVLDLFLTYTNHASKTEVPDPYYGEGKGFEHVLDLIEYGCENIIKKLS